MKTDSVPSNAVSYKGQTEEDDRRNKDEQDWLRHAVVAAGILVTLIRLHFPQNGAVGRMDVGVMVEDQQQREVEERRVLANLPCELPRSETQVIGFRDDLCYFDAFYRNVCATKCTPIRTGARGRV